MARHAYLPGAIPRLRVRRQKSGAVYYYYDHGGRPRRETPLGKDYGRAILAWCRIERTRVLPDAVAPTLRQAVEHYRAEVIAALPPTRQRPHRAALDSLLVHTGNPDMPVHLHALARLDDAGLRRSMRALRSTPIRLLRQWCLRKGYLHGAGDPACRHRHPSAEAAGRMEGMRHDSGWMKHSTPSGRFVL